MHYCIVIACIHLFGIIIVATLAMKVKFLTLVELYPFALMHIAAMRYIKGYCQYLALLKHDRVREFASVTAL